jgi:two-component system sensor histidine kinase DevS
VTTREQQLTADGLAAALLASSPDGLLLVEPDGTIALANPSAESIFGYGPGALVGTPVEALVPVEFRSGHEEQRKRYTSSPTRRPMGTGLRLFGQHADGGLFPVEISLSPVSLHDPETGDEVVHTIATVRDISDREETHARVVLMEDRERIARDLHDMVIQRLFAAGMSLQAVAGSAQPPAVAERIAATIDDLDDTIRELRNAIFHLGRPDDQPTVSEQVRQLVVERADDLGLDGTIEVDGPVDQIPDYVAAQLLATLRESLSNIARHAEATSFEVTLTVDEGHVALTVTDDGVGMAPRPKHRGGLSNMMWRAAELGGTCVVEANEPSGTRLLWRAPIP